MSNPRHSSLAVLLVVVPLTTACDSDPQLVQPTVTNEVDAGTAGAGTDNPSHSAGNAGASSGSAGSSGTGGSAGQLAAAGSNSAGGAGGSDTMQAGTAGSAGNAGAENPPGPIPYTALAVSVAEAHFCVLLDDHNVKCWGSGLYGELGDGSPTGLYPSQPQVIVNLGSGRTAQAISVNRHASCALLDDDTVKCWGFSEQLGIGATEPTGDEPNDLGDALPPVDLGEDRTATQIALGNAHGCAVLDDGNVRCWERDPHETFQVEGPAIVQLAAGFFPMARFADGSFGSPESNSHDFLSGAKTIDMAGDSRNVCALLETGMLSCTDMSPWPDMPLDITSTVSFGLYGAYGGSGFCTLDDQGIVRCAGAIEYPDLWMMPGAEVDGVGLVEVNLGGKAVQLASGGDRYACAVLEDGRVKCWGDWHRAGNYGSVDGEIQALDLGTH